MQLALADTADCDRINASRKLDPMGLARLGQYMAPAPISRIMASLFCDVSGDVRVPDPGALFVNVVGSFFMTGKGLR